jgi:hypothetical protein
MKVAAAISQVNQPKENGFDLNFLILRTQRRATRENNIIMDSWCQCYKTFFYFVAVT